MVRLLVALLSPRLQQRHPLSLKVVNFTQKTHKYTRINFTGQDKAIVEHGALKICD